MTDAVLAHLLARREAFLADLARFVACPSVSTDPAYAEGIAAARAFLRAKLTALGFDRVREAGAGGHPAVLAEWRGAGAEAPTLLVYGHYDVQPPDPTELWRTPPFALTLRDGRLHARGASDDKGPSLIALETLGAFLAVEGRLPVNVTLLIEGEEEVGSATLGAILGTERDALQADAVLSADGARWRADMPTMTVATRGNAGFEFSIRTAAKDLHSGRHGGVVRNALHEMARLVASLHDDAGAIAVPGFLDGVAEPDAAQRAAMAAIPFDEAAYYAGLGATLGGEAERPFLERLWLRPTLEVNGMWGGYTGAGGKTVIPDAAHAKLSMRLVPGQDPARCVEAVIAHLRARCPEGVVLHALPPRGGSAAYALPGAHPLLLAAEAALEETAGRAPVRVRMGATLPLSDIVQRTLGIDTVMFSFATADEDIHAPNEFLRESAIAEGFAAWTSLIRRAGRLRPADFASYRRG